MGNQNDSGKKPINAKSIMQEKNEQEKAKQYNKYVENKTPKPDLLKDMFNAFWVGGLICTVGQFFNNFYSSRGFEEEDAAAYVTISLILLAVLLTGVNLFSKLTKIGGAGSLVPITGFANSMVAPALEYKKEGIVLGAGAKLFTVAGPVLVCGITAATTVGVLYWLAGLL